MDELLTYYQNKFNQTRLAQTDASIDQFIIEFVDDLLAIAINFLASDIHIEPHVENCRIRFRVDGLLKHALTLPATLATRVITRLKIMAELDIGEKRLPQDGRLSLSSIQHCDIRLSTCPSLYGEKIVLRILRQAGLSLTLHEIGLSAKQLELLLQTLQQPQGLIIVAGPTGSGKTATLYAALQHINSCERNMISIENPVEITLAGITQINVNTRIGLDFANVLRAVLRQDPDVMMIGEIRDPETAAMVVQASQTGHLVLTTLHANDIEDVLPRLKTLGVLADELPKTLIITQRLIRKYDSIENCYRGRTGIFAMATYHTTLSAPETLWDSANDKLDASVTLPEEVIRVLGKPPL